MSTPVDRIQKAIRPVSSKWSLEVLSHVRDGPVGFNDLARGVGIDHKQLGRTLRCLLQVGLVFRDIDDNPPVRVRYGLTPYGQDMMSVLDGLAARWPCLYGMPPMSSEDSKSIMIEATRE